MREKIDDNDLSFSLWEDDLSTDDFAHWGFLLLILTPFFPSSQNIKILFLQTDSFLATQKRVRSLARKGDVEKWLRREREKRGKKTCSLISLFLRLFPLSPTHSYSCSTIAERVIALRLLTSRFIVVPSLSLSLSRSLSLYFLLSLVFLRREEGKTPRDKNRPLIDAKERTHNARTHTRLYIFHVESQSRSEYVRDGRAVGCVLFPPFLGPSPKEEKDINFSGILIKNFRLCSSIFVLSRSVDCQLPFYALKFL